MIIISNSGNFEREILRELLGVALVAEPPNSYSTTDIDTHHVSDIYDTMVNLVFGCLWYINKD